VDLEQFIANNIQSVEELEILLLLHRSPETFWAVEAISQHLGIKPELVSSRAHELERKGLLKAGESGPIFRFDNAEPDAVATVSELDIAYRDRRISVLNAIYSANLTRLRTFADAFKLDSKK
jgi:hypothetical protein